jgi:catechol 2,3-dioxygenase-like lactoylglutathione lyase family enzyme
MDDDLGKLSLEQLVDEVRRLRAGIRAHRDSTGHDLCWHHPDLWKLLPEPLEQRVAVPAWPQFLRGCIRYRQSLDEQLPDAVRTTREFEDEPRRGPGGSDVPPRLRLARPVSDLARARSMYCAGLGLSVLGSFEDHQGFDGVMLGAPAAPYHFEFTTCGAHPLVPRPTAEDLVVLYLPDRREWERRCGEMRAAGFRQVASFNPYWEVRGCTFEDPDGYRTVLECSDWGGAVKGR